MRRSDAICTHIHTRVHTHTRTSAAHLLGQQRVLVVLDRLAGVFARAQVRIVLAVTVGKLTVKVGGGPVDYSHILVIGELPVHEAVAELDLLLANLMLYLKVELQGSDKRELSCVPLEITSLVLDPQRLLQIVLRHRITVVANDHLLDHGKNLRIIVEINLRLIRSFHVFLVCGLQVLSIREHFGMVRFESTQSDARIINPGLCACL